ncbi:hypothetical protein V1477_017601 [Vespula maculifrons]|uniref:Uncharacterized protein n=1 Tax=Vespula maculifrons TaxID=7453 RepID=A0ABD2B6I7_VESMC
MQQPPSGGTWVGNTCDLNAKWGYTASKDDNNIGSLVDLYSSWFSCALDFEQLTCEVGIVGFE